MTVYKLDRFSRDKYATAIYKKTLKDNGVKVLYCMENIPDTPEGIILESLLEGYKGKNGHIVKIIKNTSIYAIKSSIYLLTSIIIIF